MIGAAIRSHLAADTNVNALLGDRIYPLKVPQSPTFPCARYTVVSDVADRHHGGQTKLRRALVQIDCFSTKYAEADQLAAAIETLLGGFKGTLGNGPNARTVQAIFSQGRNDAYDDQVGSDSDPEGIYGKSSDYEIWYLEP